MTNDKKVEFFNSNFSNLENTELEFLLKKSLKVPDIIKRIYNYKIFRENKIKEMFMKIQNETIITTTEKNNYRFMMALKEKGFELKSRFTIKQLRETGLPLEKMKTFLYSLGYEWKYNSFMFDNNIDSLSKKLIM
jgi:hypothetical protein